MRINPIGFPIPFKKHLKITLEDKSITYDNGKPSTMMKIIQISGKNKTGIFVNKDVFLLDSTEKMKEDLDREGINYEEVDKID